MTETPEIRTDISPSSPLNWQLRGGRLFVETETGDMENIFEDKGKRVTRSEATTILQDAFDFSADDVFTPDFFATLQDRLPDSPSVDEYEDLVGQLVDRAATLPGIDAKHTVVSDEGMVWTSTQNYQRKGAALVVLKDIDEGLFRTRTPEVLSTLGERLPAALETAEDRAKGDSDSCVLGLMKVLETIGASDSHALLKILYAGNGGQVPLGSQFYSGIDADLIFLPEHLLPTPLGEVSTVREMDQVWFRGNVSPDEGARLDIDIPPELLEVMGSVVQELNRDRKDPSQREVTKSTLFRLAIRLLDDAEGAVTISEEASRDILEASEGDLVGTTVYLEPEVYSSLYDYAEAHDDAREQAIVRLLVSAVTTVLANMYGVETWRPAAIPMENANVLYELIEDSDILRDVDLPEPH